MIGTLYKRHILLQNKLAICICDRNFNYVDVLNGSGILQEILKNSEVNSRRILYSKYKLLFERRFPPSPFDSTIFFIMYIYYDVIIVVYDLFVCSRYDFIIYSWLLLGRAKFSFLVVCHIELSQCGTWTRWAARTLWLAVGTGGPGGHVLPCPPSFWQIRKIYIKGGRLCPRNYYLSPEFSNLPTAMPWLALKLIANHIRCPTSHCEKQTSVLHITSIRLVVHLMLLYAHQL